MWNFLHSSFGICQGNDLNIKIINEVLINFELIEHSQNFLSWYKEYIIRWNRSKSSCWLYLWLILKFSLNNNFSINNVFLCIENHKGSLNWWKFILFIKEQLIYLNTLIKFYFSFKFLSKSMRFRLPTLTKSSYILNNEFLGLLYLSNAFVQTSKELQYLYSSAANFFDYKQFTDKLIGLASNLLSFNYTIYFL